MIFNALIILIGIYIIIEAIVSIIWLRNFGPVIWQIGRCVRIVSGIALIVVGLYITLH